MEELSLIYQFWSMTIINFLEFQSAPFACCWAKNVSFIELNILNWMSKTKFVYASASCSVSSYLDDRHRVNQYLSIGSMSFNWHLYIYHLFFLGIQNIYLPLRQLARSLYHQNDILGERSFSLEPRSWIEIFI